jgi:transcriptional regulator
MYIPPAFRVDDMADVQRTMREARAATLVTATQEGLIGTPLPMLLNENEGPNGTLYAHVARANPQWKLTPSGEAMAIFVGPEAYVSPSWYATKQETHKVVPTWNYVAVHAYGPVEFFDDAERLLDVITRLTDLHEQPRKDRWAVTDAPTDFIKAQLRGIIGLRMPISRLDGKRKMSQNRNLADRAGVINGLSESHRPEDQVVASLIPQD